MTDSEGDARLDRRMLVAGLGMAAIAGPSAARGPEADAELLALEERLGEVLWIAADVTTARSAAEQRYLARRWERPSHFDAPARDVAAMSLAALQATGLRRRQADWAETDAALRHKTRRDAFAARAAALEGDAEALTLAILARPAVTTAGLAAKARLARSTGDDRFARSLVEDVLRLSGPLNAA